MSIPASGAIFSIAPQAAKIGGSDPTDFVIGDYDWYRFRAQNIGLAPMQDQQTLPPETGGPIVPDYEYKQAQLLAGDTDFFPRTDFDFGLLMWAAMGEVSSVLVTTGVYQHHFRFAADNFTLPWFAAREYIPAGSGDAYGQYGYDCKVTNLALQIPAMGVIGSSVSILGRCFHTVEDPTWAYFNELEDPATIPVSGNQGEFKIGGTSYPILGAQIELANNTTGPREEIVIGSYYMDDIVPLYRAATIRLVYKYDTPVLFENLYKNGGSAWDPMPFVTNEGGGEYGFEAVLNSPAKIGATAHYYGLGVTFSKVSWRLGRPLQLQSGAIVTQEIIGTALRPDTGNQYAELTLKNATSSYGTWGA